ncbi:MAG: AraC family transcriptional regulator [Acidobacteria bacterium]|nr:MAG: AraC family transcriptional regulator [Acidobacteriota bacterium]
MKGAPSEVDLLIEAVLDGSVAWVERYPERVQKVWAYMVDHLSEAGLTIEEVAVEVGVSRSHLFRLFREEVGVSPRVFWVGLRVAWARRLLGDRRYTISEVAWGSGFKTLRGFERAFKQWTGCTPKVYRKQIWMGASQSGPMRGVVGE